MTDRGIAKTMAVYSSWHYSMEKAEPPDVAPVEGTNLCLDMATAARYKQVRDAKLAAQPTYHAGANAYCTQRASIAIYRTHVSSGYRRGRGGSQAY